MFAAGALCAAVHAAARRGSILNLLVMMPQPGVIATKTAPGMPHVFLSAVERSIEADVYKAVPWSGPPLPPCPVRGSQQDRCSLMGCAGFRAADIEEKRKSRVISLGWNAQ
jgi:hypothetical protein